MKEAARQAVVKNLSKVMSVLHIYNTVSLIFLIKGVTMQAKRHLRHFAPCTVASFSYPLIKSKQ